MPRRHESKPTAGGCQKTYKSVLAGHCGKGNKVLDPLRQECQFRAGQDIPLKRDGRVGFYCIQNGYLRLNYRVKNTHRAVRISGPGHIVGFASSVSDSYTATALEALEACYFDLEIFLMLLTKSPELSQAVIKWLCELIVVRDDRISTLGAPTARAKVASTFVSLANKFGRSTPDGALVIAPTIDRRTLAELSGTAIETFSRVITELEADKIITREGRAIKIHSMQALRDCM